MLGDDGIVIGGILYSISFFDGCDCTDCEIEDWCAEHSFSECCNEWIGEDQIWRREVFNVLGDDEDE